MRQENTFANVRRLVLDRYSGAVVATGRGVMLQLPANHDAQNRRGALRAGKLQTCPLGTAKHIRASVYCTYAEMVAKGLLLVLHSERTNMEVLIGLLPVFVPVFYLSR